MFGKRLGPRPAAHSIFKNPREIDAYGGFCGGAGAEDAPAGASERVTTESNRTIRYKATTRAERATSQVGAKIGSSRVV